MKKLLIAVILSAFGIIPAFADATTSVTFPPTAQNTLTFPPTAQNSFLNGQVAVEIVNHGSFFSQYRSGYADKMILDDNIVEAGHIKNLYAWALDASLYDSPKKSGLFPFDYQAGAKLNLHALLLNYVTLTPGWQSIVGNIEGGPRVGYDFGEDKKHAWFATFNIGLGFGPGSGVAPAQ